MICIHNSTKQSIRSCVKGARYLSFATVFAAVFLLLGFAAVSFAEEELSMEKLKEEIKREIIKEILSGKSSADGGLESFKEEIKRELLQELRKEQQNEKTKALEDRRLMTEQIQEAVLKDLKVTPKKHPQSVNMQGTAVGNANGRMLRRGIPLQGCRVKAVFLSGSAGKFVGYRENEEFICVTDKDGVYRFEGIPGGPYKLKWELPGDRGWIRRLRDAPDFQVRAGRLSEVGDLETAKPLVPH